MVQAPFAVQHEIYPADSAAETFPTRGTIRVLRSIDELERLAPEWNELVDRGARPNVFQRWEWVRSWLGTVGADRALQVHVARDVRGRLAGIAPLALSRQRLGSIAPYTRLEFLGSEGVAADHLDFIIDRDHLGPVYRALAGSVARRRGEWTIFRAEGLSGRSPLPGLFSRAMPGRVQEVNMLDYLACHYIELPETWEKLRSQLSKNLRHGMERQARRLAGAGGDGLVFRRVSHPDELTAALSAVVELHQSVQTSRGNEGSFANPTIAEFHRRVAADFQRSGILRVYLIELNGVPIAGLYGFKLGEVFSSYSTGYLQEHAQYGPGRQVLWYAIREMIAEGALEYDHLRGDEGYKQGWSDLMRHDVELVQSSGPYGDFLLSSAPVLRSAKSRISAKVAALRAKRPEPTTQQTAAAGE